MVTKLTVKEYAELLGISTVAVYKKISNQTINSTKENNRTLVLVEDKELTNPKKVTNQYRDKLQTNSLESYLKVENKQLKKQVKKLRKELKGLHEKLEKFHAKKESLLIDYVSEMKKLYLPVLSVDNKEDEIIINEPIKKKKKKSKKGGKTK